VGHTSADACEADDCCATRWPLLLVHGIGFRDTSRFRYWGRIPAALSARGARVQYGFQDAWGTFEGNARVLRDTLLATVVQMEREKLNIIAHSKGGLDARVLASMEDCAPHIASLTTIASPHAGSRTLDAIMRVPAPLFKAAAVPVNGIFRLLGDDNPDFYAVCSQLTTGSMRCFNNEHPSSEHIFCQSYAGLMERPLDDIAMTFTHLVVRRFDGANDGLVGVVSAPFGNFNGTITGALGRGVSHCDVIDRRRRPLKARARCAVADGNVQDVSQDQFDIVDWYVRLVADLKARGL
jgi:triacylglycerol lipase